MGRLCVRAEGSGPRLFPPVTGALWLIPPGSVGVSSPVEAAARRLLALAERPRGLAQGARGWGLDAPGAVGRALWLFRQGVSAEQAGRWRRADFYWGESRRALQSLLARPGAWEAVVRSAVGAEEGLPDAAGWLRALVADVFIDTHCGFYNARVLARKDKGLAADDRAFAHARAIEEWLSPVFGARAPAERAALLSPGWEQRFDAARNAKQWRQAQDAAQAMHKLFPGDPQWVSRLCEIEFTRTLEGLRNHEFRQGYLDDADRLRRGITALEAFHAKHPDSIGAFEAIGNLYQIRAIKLANAGSLANALVDARRALDYWPGIDRGEETLKQVHDMLVALISKTREIRFSLRQRYGATLTEEGQRLCAEADRGFTPLEDYLSSQQPGRLAEALRVARNHDVWRRVGLDTPADQFDERSSALVENLVAVLEAQPATVKEAKRRWLAAVKDKELLSTVDTHLAVRFLASHLSTPPKDEVEAAAPPVEAVVLDAPARRRWWDAEPLGLWLASPRDRWVKAATVAAVLLLVAGAAGATHRDRDDQQRARAHAAEVRAQQARDHARDEALRAQRERQHLREEAYINALEARRENDHLGVIRGAEAFFERLTPEDTDAHAESLRTLYDEAMVRWFAGRVGADDDESRLHVERYRRLAFPIRTS